MDNSNKNHVLTYGDASFVDYIAEDTTNTSFSMFLGGATVNVAVGVARLGVPSAFITITGDDETSAFVRGELQKEDVIMDYAKLEPDKRVSGVYVHLTEDHDRIFHTYIDEAPAPSWISNSVVALLFNKLRYFFTPSCIYCVYT